jgi:hypothetical protein
VIPATEHGLFVAAARHLLGFGWAKTGPGQMEFDWNKMAPNGSAVPVNTEPDLQFVLLAAGGASLKVPGRLLAEVQTVQQAADLLVTMRILPRSFHSLEVDVLGRRAGLVPCTKCGRPMLPTAAKHPYCPGPIVVGGVR